MALAAFPGARFRNSGQRPKNSLQSFFHNYTWSRRLTNVCYLYHMPHDFLLDSELCCDTGDWWRFNGSIVCSNAEPTILMHQIEPELYHWSSVLLSGLVTNIPERNSKRYQSLLILLIFLLTPWSTKVIEKSSSVLIVIKYIRIEGQFVTLPYISVLSFWFTSAIKCLLKISYPI